MATPVVRIKTNYKGIDLGGYMLDVPKKLRQFVLDGVQAEAGEYLKDYAAAHTKTGVLASSYFDTVTYEGRGRRVGFDLQIAPHAKWLNEGASWHPIVARNARALAFYWPKVGRFVFFKSVNHPGYKGDDYITQAYLLALDAVRQIVNDARI